MGKEIFAVVLAAGSASRFGGTKQLADIDGCPMVRLAVDSATRTCGERTLLITGHDSSAVARACAGPAPAGSPPSSGKLRNSSLNPSSRAAASHARAAVSLSL